MFLYKIDVQLPQFLLSVFAYSARWWQIFSQFTHTWKFCRSKLAVLPACMASLLTMHLSFTNKEVIAYMITYQRHVIIQFKNISRDVWMTVTKTRELSVYRDSNIQAKQVCKDYKSNSISELSKVYLSLSLISVYRD